MKPWFMPLLIAAANGILAGCGTVNQVERLTPLLGSAVAPNTGTRTIAITPRTRHVNVVGGETINFIVGEKSFAWHFFVGAGVTSFDLQKVAPPGMLEHSVIAYVAADPRYCCR